MLAIQDEMPPPPMPPVATKPKRNAMEVTESVQTITGVESEDEEEAVEVENVASQQPAKPKRLKLIFGTWILGKTVGTGSSGSVKLVVHKDIGKKCVVKAIKRQIDDPDQPPIARNRDGVALREHFMIREALVGVALDHPNIIKMHSYVIGKNHFYFFYEFLEGMDLADYISEKGRINEPDALKIFSQLLNGIDYIHKCNVIHRDLKLENIRINPLTLHTHILDFGFSTFFSPKFKQHSSCGSPCYASPEIYLHKPYRGPEVDVWSLGVCLYGMVVAALPFEKDCYESLTECVIVGKFYMPEFASRPLQQLLSQMLALDPIQRISVPDILISPWVLNSVALPPAAETATLTPSGGRRIKAMYRSSADVALSPLFGMRSNAFFERVRGSMTASGTDPLKPPIASTTLAKPGSSGHFDIEWVEGVLRMERHARAEFLMRELERRAVHRKWSLEREWRNKDCRDVPRFADGDIVIAAGKKVDLISGKKKKTGSSGWGRFAKGAFSLKGRKAVEECGTPAPIRSKNLVDRVFRKPLASPFSVTSESTTTGKWSNQIFPLSFASRWNLPSRDDGSKPDISDTAGDIGNERNKAVRKLFRKWSTVPAFVDEANTKMDDVPQNKPSTALSHLTLFNETATDLPDSPEDPDAITASSPPRQFAERAYLSPIRTPMGVFNWFKKRFELENVLKSKRQTLTALNLNSKGKEEFEADDKSDTESFECIKPTNRTSFYERIGKRLWL